MTNISLLAIPVYWLLTLLPHSYAIAIMRKANNGRWDNSNPRSSKWDATLRESTPAAVYGRYERAEATHKNGMENFPIFVGAILAGNIAKLDTSRLNAFVGAYVSLRVVYTFAYISITSNGLSFFRTLVWLVSTSMVMGIYVLSGLALA